MIQLNKIEKKLAEQLLLTIKKGERYITYGELAKCVNTEIHHRQIGKHIAQISILCHELGLPLLSAKVRNQSTKMPGMGFYPLYEMMGIPTNGKTEQELYKSELQAIRNCKEWYKLEDYLGLDIGLPRPTPRQSPKLLDARQAYPYAKSVDVLNICFGEEYLGKHYDGWMMGALVFKAKDINYSIWFPKLSINGKAASKSGWINTITDDGRLIEEYGSENTFMPSEVLSLVFAKQGNDGYRFKGVFVPDMERSTGDHHYYYKIADVADFRTSVPAIYRFDDERASDDKLIAELRDEEAFVPAKGFVYNGKPVPVPELKQVQERKVYPRNKQKAINALAHAGYVCEIDSKHLTFKRKRSGIPYTEPHHLVPMAEQYHFNTSLDVEENIVSLCSTCHNHIHYGEGAEELLKKLYKTRKKALASVGIVITEEELLSYYK